jgi:thioredoxin-dependent peroxiredoxin
MMLEIVKLEPGFKAPELNLPNHRGEEFDFAALPSQKAVVYFFPAAGSPGCTKEAVDLQDNLATLEAAGYRVIGISPDRPEKLDDFIDAHQLTFDLLSDEDLVAHKAWGAFGEKNLYGRLYRGMLRSTIVVDENGLVTHAMYNVKATGHAKMLLRKLGLEG